MRFESILPSIEADKFCLLDAAEEPTAERGYLIVFDDGSKAVVDELTFERFFRRADNGDSRAPEAGTDGGKDDGAGTPTGRGPEKRKTRVYRRDPKEPDAAPVTGVESRMPSDGPRARILGLLAKRPMTSADLIRAMKCPPAHVYTACHNLKAAGEIEHRMGESDTDFEKLWHLIKGNTQ